MSHLGGFVASVLAGVLLTLGVTLVVAPPTAPFPRQRFGVCVAIVIAASALLSFPVGIPLRFGGIMLIDAFIYLVAGLGLRLGSKPVPWPWIGLLWAIVIASDVAILHSGHQDQRLSWLGAALYLLIRFFNGDGMRKRLGQLRASTLTAVQSFRLQQQVKEMHL